LHDAAKLIIEFVFWGEIFEIEKKLDFLKKKNIKT
jgi:hypothetical protein